MKLKIIFITLFLLFYNISKSQKLIGLSGGINIPKVINNYSSPHLQVKSDFKNTYTVAVSYTDRLKKHFDLGFELNYVNAAVDLEITSGGLGGGYDTEYVNYDFGFLNFGILPEFVTGNKLQLFINAGPYFGFLVNTNKDAHGNIQTPDIGVTGNIGIRVQVFSIFGVVIKNGYSYGLVNKYPSIKTMNIMVSAGLYFFIRGNKKD